MAVRMRDGWVMSEKGAVLVAAVTTYPNPLSGPDPMVWVHMDLCQLFS